MPPAKNFLDELVFRQLNKLGLPPSALCDDSTFIRRVTLDIAGRLPTLDETQKFLADKNADRFEKLVDRLLASPDYADYFAGKSSAVLRNRRTNPKEDARPTFAFHAWIRESLDKNVPFDQFVRGVLTAKGEAIKTPAVAWYREVKDVSSQVEDTAQLFLGQRIACRKCHHHPLEKWTTNDYWRGGVFQPGRCRGAESREEGQEGGDDRAGPIVDRQLEAGQGRKRRIRRRSRISSRRGWTVRSSRSTPTTIPRQARRLADRAKESLFCSHACQPLLEAFSRPRPGGAGGRHAGDEPADQSGAARRAGEAFRGQQVRPEKAGAGDLHVECLSPERGAQRCQRGRSAELFAHFLPRRLNAEVLFDAIDQVTLSKPAFKGVPAGTRAVQLPDNQFESYFLSVFGRPDFASACECERSSDSSLRASPLQFRRAGQEDRRRTAQATGERQAPRGRSAARSPT